MASSGPEPEKFLLQSTLCCFFQTVLQIAGNVFVRDNDYLTSNCVNKGN